MTTKSIPALLASLLLTVGVLSAAAAKTDAELIAAARKTYPLKTCLVSNEPLGSMGEASGYIYRAKGQPDRVVFFCCEGCGDDFKANPAKFLAKVDDAAAQAAKSGKKG
jgi:YHS domain-containing protein